MNRDTFRSKDLLALPLLLLTIGWYFVFAAKLAVVFATRFTGDRLWEFCVNNVPAGLPPLTESTMPLADSRTFPIEYICTYTQTVPHMSVVHTDYIGTTIAVLPFAILLALFTIRFTKVIETRSSRKTSMPATTGEVTK